MSKPIDYVEFRQFVIEQIRQIEAQRPEMQSVEWFLLNYLRRIARYADEPATTHGMENSMRALLRFYLDSIEASSPLGERCRLVFEAHRRSLKTGNE